MYQSPVSHNTYAFMLAANGQIEQYQLVDDAVAGKINLQIVRGYHSPPSNTADWDVTADASSPPGGCVADDEMKTLYVSEKGKGIWKFGAEPGDPMTGSLIDTPTTGTPAGHLTDNTLGLALVKTGDGTGYLIASSATTTTTAPVTPPTSSPDIQVPTRSGYWMVGNDGRVYNFGDSKSFGDATLAAGAQAVDLEPTPSGNGYWIVDDFGHVFAKG